MTYVPKSRFTGKETPEEFARKMNDELMHVSRAQGTVTIIQATSGGGSGGSGGGGSTTVTASWSRYFMTMGA
jgi:hypothetical protein